MRFFFYGTLMTPRLAPGPLALVLRRAAPLGTGRVRGRLHDLGDFPGGIPDDSAETRIVGEVFELPDDPRLLQALDAYEAFDPDSPDPCLFERREVDVALSAGGSSRCWMYVFNGETRDAPPIDGGPDLHWSRPSSQPREPGAP